MNRKRKCASKRLTKELKEIENVEGISIAIHPNDIFKWSVILDGPPESPYQKGKFKLELKFPSDYPFKPPSVRFLDKVYHPNIYRDGKICIDILQNNGWSPALNVVKVLHSLRSLFMDPNPNSPANRPAAVLYVNNYKKYCETVREYVENMLK